MKLKYLAALAIASVLTVGAITVVNNVQFAQANPCAATVNPCAGADSCAGANPCAGEIMMTAQGGAFEGVAHPTLGTATIVETDGKRYLEFDETFRSDSGPDLFVLLHKEAIPENYNADQFVNLGDLQSTEGSQRYEIPEDVTVKDFASVVIWCRQFNVTFGYAAL